MKTIILATALLALNASAHTIVGTPVLPGTLKYKMVINTVKTTCKIKIERIRNLQYEDSYGNPGYTVRLNASLDGSDYERNLKVRFSQDFNLTNMFQVGNTLEVRDYDYFSPEGTTMKIKTDGRLQEVTFPFNGQKITCSF